MDPAEAVSLRHVIRTAASLARSPAQVAERLSTLGYSTPDVSRLTRDDLALISRGLTAPAEREQNEHWSPLDPAEPVSLGHVILAAVRLGRSPAQVTERLSSLGYSPPDATSLPGDITDNDLALISHGLTAPAEREQNEHWSPLDPAEPVSLGHVILAAVRLGRSPAQVTERLSSLGYSPPDATSLPGDITSDDLVLISDDLTAPAAGERNRPGWLDPAEPVSLGYIIGASVRLNRSPSRVAERLSALGYRPPDVTSLPGDISRGDLALISRDLSAPDWDEGLFRRYRPNWRRLSLDPTELISLGHVIGLAARLYRSPAQVAERLSALGYSPPDVTSLPGFITDSDLALIRRDPGVHAWGDYRWLEPAEPVSFGHVIGVAVRLGRSPVQVAGRLSALGYSPPDVTSLPGDITSDDLAMISHGLSAPHAGDRDRHKWLDPAEPVSLGHVILAAVRLGRSPVQVAGRLSALGYSPPDVSSLPGDFTPDDLALISAGLTPLNDRDYEHWSSLDPADPIPLVYVIVVAVRLGRSPAEVAGRLSALGYSPPDIASLPGDISRDDLALINDDLTALDDPDYEDWSPLDPAESVPLVYVIVAAARLGRSPAQVAGRLSALGYSPPDIASLPGDISRDDLALINDDLTARPPDIASLPGDIGDELALIIDGLTARPPDIASLPGDIGDELALINDGLTARPPDIASLPGDIGRDDPALINDALTARGVGEHDKSRWLYPAGPVSLLYVIRTAVRLGRSPAQVSKGLITLGYRVPAFDLFPRGRPGEYEMSART